MGIYSPFVQHTAGVAQHTSARERNAIEAERAVTNLKMAEYMEGACWRGIRGSCIGE